MHNNSHSPLIVKPRVDRIELSDPPVVARLNYQPDGNNITAISARRAPRHETGIKPPELDPIAYHGTLGEIVKKMMPHTEASGPSLLVQGLVSIGNLLGRRAWTLAGARDHFTNLYAVTVGESAVGRKGEAWAMLKRYVFPTLTDSDKSWLSRIAHGAASGTGLIFAMRDPTEKEETEEETDPAERDKRLLLEESEFGGMLDIMNRDGNNLSAVLRDAWDGDPLGNLAMKNRDDKSGTFLRASGYHFSLNCHITKSELKEKLPIGSKTANGLANRILWCYSLRDKLLPRGGQFSVEDIEFELLDLRNAIEFSRKNCREFSFDNEAGDFYDQWYRTFHKRFEGDDSGFAKIISRGDAQTKRLSLLFAILDMSPDIRSSHLNAALAIWGYCERSAKWAFFESEFTTNAQRIHDFLSLKPDLRATLTEIQNTVFRNNLLKAKLDAAIWELEKAKAVRVDVKEIRKVPPQAIKTVVLVSS